MAGGTEGQGGVSGLSGLENLGRLSELYLSQVRAALSREQCEDTGVCYSIFSL